MSRVFYELGSIYNPGHQIVEEYAPRQLRVLRTFETKAEALAELPYYQAEYGGNETDDSVVEMSMTNTDSTADILARRQARIAAQKAQKRRDRYAARKDEVAANESARYQAILDRSFLRGKDAATYIEDSAVAETLADAKAESITAISDVHRNYLKGVIVTLTARQS